MAAVLAPAPALVAAPSRPAVLAGERILEVPAVLAGLFPAGGLRRGSTIGVKAPGMGSALALALAAISAASAAGSWGAAVGLPGLGLVAAAQLGLSLERFALIPEPGDQWAIVTAALLDAMDVVLLAPPERVRSADARRLAARARERGAVLLVLGESWPERLDLRLAVTDSVWLGLEQGHGYLRARMVEITTSGRGAASRLRCQRLWLPGPTGEVAAVTVLDEEMFGGGELRPVDVTPPTDVTLPTRIGRSLTSMVG